MSKFKGIFALVLCIALVISVINSSALATDSESAKYDKYFSVERAFYSTATDATANPTVPDKYHFIHEVSETPATNDLEQSVIESLVPGYLYTKNWKTGEVELIIAIKLTSYALTENNVLYAADNSGKIYEFTLDGVRKAELVDMSSAGGEIRNMTANDDLIVFTIGKAAYRFYLPTKTLDNLGSISTTEPDYFWASTNNTINWSERTDSSDPHEPKSVTYQKNLTTGKITVINEHESDRSAAVYATSYFSDDGSECDCHGYKKACDTTSSDGNTWGINCDCKTGYWNGAAAIQCQGYAYDWYSNHVSKTSSGQTKLGSVSFVNISDSEKLARLYDLLDDCCYGANMRVNNDNHSLIMLTPSSASSLSITDANWSGGRCAIRTANYTPANFVKAFTSITNVWTQSHNYQSFGGVTVCTICGRQ